MRKTTRDRLRSVGRKGETYDALVNRLLDSYLSRPVDFEEIHD